VPPERAHDILAAMIPTREWVEVALDYRCNLRCLGCRACEDTGASLSPTDALAVLREARAARIANLWIGGGEPTLRPELPSLIAAARKLGFSRVLVQTNGVRLSYLEYAAALVHKGATDLSFNVKSHRAEVHDALGRSPGSHALLLKALANVSGLDVSVAADVLLARSSLPDLAATIDSFAERGISRFTLWLLSAADSDDAEVTREIPSFAELVAPVHEAFEVAARRGVELVSLHTPPCTLAPEHRAQYLPAAKLRLQVVDPSGRSFPLESSPFEGGRYVDSCSRCSARQGCAGLREDHLRLHGAGDLEALD